MKEGYLLMYPIAKRQASLFDLNGDFIEFIELPLIFSYPVRIDIIRRAVHSAFTAKIQIKARDPLAGKRRVGESWGIGYSVARVPRLSNGRAVLAPNVVGGRRQFAPTVFERIHEEINRKEMRLAIISALAALADRGFVLKRGYILPDKIRTVPIVVVDDFENLATTKQVKEYLKKLELWNNIVRAQKRIRIRAGKGKMRGRRYITPKSLLFIISSAKSPVTRAIRNLPGADYLTPDNLNILKLAPGGLPGRLAIISQKALKLIERRYVVEKP
ncbi:MAG: 50S ribosomal protein L4 [Ignisphaera sp.]